MTVLVAWAMGIEMDLNFNILETVCLALAILTTSFTLQVQFHLFIYNILNVIRLFDTLNNEDVYNINSFI